MAIGTQTQPQGKLLDYEQFIDHQLQRTRPRIKFTDISTACLTLLVGFLAVLFLEVVFDHVFGMPFWLRWTILVSGLLAAGVYAAIRVVMPLVRRINALYAAKTIEMSEPTFKNSLINYLELRRQSRSNVEGHPGHARVPGRQRLDPRRCRRGRESEADDPGGPTC